MEMHTSPTGHKYEPTARRPSDTVFPNKRRLRDRYKCAILHRVERRKGKTAPTRPETPAARLSFPPAPADLEATTSTDPPRPRVARSDFKSLLPDDAGRYSKNSKRQSSAAGILSPRERTLLATLRERAPCLAQLIASSVEGDEARDALQELDALLTGKRSVRSSR